MAEYYITEERAMAPGISGDWPQTIPKPDNRNGRLVKLEGLEDLLKELADEAEQDGLPELSIRIKSFL